MISMRRKEPNHETSARKGLMAMQVPVSRLPLVEGGEVTSEQRLRKKNLENTTGRDHPDSGGK